MKSIIILIVLLLIVLSITIFIVRQKYLKRIKQLEHEKLQIQNQPIFEEMTKIKQLNMTGETEEKFERWRKEWTEVVDVHMVEIDDLFFDAEEAVDRLRFKRASEIELEVHQRIQRSEEKMHLILQELEELVGSEEKNRLEVESLQEKYREARRNVLAHQHAFGRSVEPLEKALASFKEEFEKYEELTNNGNYLQARELVIALTEQGNELFKLVETIPRLLKELQVRLPNTLREIRNGTREMEGQQYYLAHLEIEKQCEKTEERLKALIAKVETLEIHSIQEEVDGINEKIDQVYEALEEEVRARRYVELNSIEVEEQLAQATIASHEVTSEMNIVQRSYRLPEEEVRIPQEYARELSELNKRFELFTQLVNERQSAYSILQQELASIKDTTRTIDTDQLAFKEKLKNLRTDELVVRKEVEYLTRELQRTDRLLHRGNIPGIPGEMDVRLEEAEEQVYVVQQGLQEVPLNMVTIQANLDKARAAVGDVTERVEELLENVMLIERIIQYGNRYRATNEEVHKGLLEAEESFREFRYAKALEEAATVVEAAEPGAIERIEQLLQVEQ